MKPVIALAMVAALAGCNHTTESRWALDVTLLDHAGNEQVHRMDHGLTASDCARGATYWREEQANVTVATTCVRQ